MKNTKLDVRVYLIDEPKGNTKAFASISVNDLIAIRGIRVVEGEKGLFIAMPQSFDKKTNKYRDVAFPLNGDLRKEISSAILDEHDRVSQLAPNQRGYERPEPIEQSGINVEDIKLGIRIYPLDDPQSNTKAFASVSIDGLIAIRGVRVVDGEKGLFVAMPQSLDKLTAEYHDIAFPLVGDLRKEIRDRVLEKYEARKPSLGDRLADGAEKAANHVAPQRTADRTQAAAVI